MRVSVQITGVTPLLMSRFTEKNEIAVSGGTQATYLGHRGTPREQAEDKAYKDKDTGELYIPGPNILATIIAAGIFHKAGKSKLTTQRSSLIPAGVMLEELVCPLGIKEWEVDSRSVVVPSTGGRIMCHRPRIDKWSCYFTLEIDESMFSPDLIRKVVDDAGKKIGLGDYRPARKGPFGRFAVTRWEIREEKIKEKRVSRVA